MEEERPGDTEGTGSAVEDVVPCVKGTISAAKDVVPCMEGSLGASLV